MPKLRIGVVVDNEFTNDLRVENEVISLRKSGFDVYVLCLNYGSKPSIEDFNDAKIIRIYFPKVFQNKLRPFVNTPFDVYSFLWKRFISRFVKEYKIGVIHIHDLYLAKPIINSKYLKQKCLVLDLHENYIESLFSYGWTKSFLLSKILSRRKWKILEKRALTIFDKVIVLSDDYKNKLQDEYRVLSKDKFIVYPNYPNHEQLMTFSLDRNILDKKDAFIIFYFGVIAKRRGIFTVLEALKNLSVKHPEIKLLLIGPVDKDDRPRFENYLQDKQIKNNIIFYSWKEIKYFPSYASISDVCLSPLIKNEQHESGIANKVFQYMLFEKPLIVSNCLPQERLVLENNCGLVFRSEDVEDFSQKILELYNSPGKRKQMGDNGKKAVLNKFNYLVAAQSLIKMNKSFENSLNNSK